MQIETMGVEEEYLVVDRETRAMVPRGNVLIGLADAAMPDEVEAELNLCQIEVATPVCATGHEVEAHLIRLRRSLDLLAQPLGLGIVAIGSHPFSSWEHQAIDRDVERYHRIDDLYQVVAREQVICGFHVHVGIPDPDLLIEVMTRVRPWLGPLLALTANSPYWSGVDTGYASFRTQVWRRWPTSGVPPLLADHAEYAALVARLKDCGAIDDPSFLYWHLRPSARYPTLEFRVGDVCMTAREGAAVAMLTRAVAETAVAEARAGVPMEDVPQEVLDAACWRASRYGAEGDLVSPSTWRPAPAAVVLEELLRHVRPALEDADDLGRVQAVVREVTKRGNGATRQRLAFAPNSSPADVVDLALVATASGGE